MNEESELEPVDIQWVDGLPRIADAPESGRWRGGRLADADAVARYARYLRTTADRLEAGELALCGLDADRGIMEYHAADDRAYNAVPTGKVRLRLYIEDVRESITARMIMAHPVRVRPEVLPGEPRPDGVVGRGWVDMPGFTWKGTPRSGAGG